MAAAESLARGGLAAGGRAARRDHGRRGGRRRVRRAVAVQRARGQGPLRLHGQRGRRRDRPLRRPPGLRRVRRREGRLPVHAHDARERPGTRRSRGSATTRSRSSRRCSRRCATASPSLELSPEPESLLTALGIDPSDPEAAIREAAETDPRVAVLVEPLLGVTLTPTMAQRLRQDQRDPGAGVAEGGLPRAAGARAGARAREDHRGARRGRLVDRVRRAGRGQPLADRDAAHGRDPRLGRDGRSRRGGGGHRAAGLHRLALVARGVPRLRRLRLLPAARDGPVRGGAARPRRGRARSRSPTSASPPAPTCTSARRCCRERREAPARRDGAAERPARARPDALGRRGAHEGRAR